ncbi:MAG: bacterial Ig-like domain-containing protein [Candidatus Onthovivens sp.]|nr:bacterial Ig-like domain-containing protein [Candidatus Onthovivens sp.]
MKNLLLLILSLFSVSLVNINDFSIKNTEESINYLYYEDFENKDITGDSGANKSVDKVTGFIFANDYQNTKTVDRNNTRMLDYKIGSSKDSYGNFAIGWIGGQSTLNKLSINETYYFDCYFEFTNTEFIYFEYKSDVYGAVRLYEDGSVKGNGGPNMVDVFYNEQTHRLSLKFTARNFAAENALGYFALVAHNPTEQSKLYIDDVAIYRSSKVYEGTFEEYPTGAFSSNGQEFQSNVYVNGSTNAEIIEEDGNKKLQVTSNSPLLNSNYNFMFMNRLGVLSIGRKYHISFDYEQENILFLWVFYRGNWSHAAGEGDDKACYAKIDFNWGGVSDEKYPGNADFQATLDTTNKKIYLDFVCTSAQIGDSTIDPYQFMFSAKNDSEHTSQNDIKFTIDNFTIEVEKVCTGIDLDTTNFVDRITFGEEIDFSGLKVIAHYSDETNEIIDYPSYTVEGFDPTKFGDQLLTIYYLGFSKTITVKVKGTLDHLELSYTRIEVERGHYPDLSDLVVRAVYTDETVEILKNSGLLQGYSIFYDGFNPFIARTYTFKISYENKAANLSVVLLECETINLDGITYEEMK